MLRHEAQQAQMAFFDAILCLYIVGLRYAQRQPTKKYFCVFIENRYMLIGYLITQILFIRPVIISNSFRTDFNNARRQRRNKLAIMTDK